MATKEGKARELAELVLALKVNGDGTRRYTTWIEASPWAKSMVLPRLVETVKWDRMRELAADLLND